MLNGVQRAHDLNEAPEVIRDLVETMTVFQNRSHPGGVTVEIVGRLNALLGEQASPQQRSRSVGKVGREREGDATTSIQSHKAREFNDLIATGERI
jgi:hypothetical protein